MKRTILAPSLFLAALAVAACSSGGGGGEAPPPVATATLTGALRMPEVAPASVGSSAAALYPMVAGEVVVWLDAGKTVGDLDVQRLDALGMELVRPTSGPTAVFHARRAEGKSSVRDGARPEDSCEQATCDAADAIATVAGVRCASPNYLLQACINPSDTFYDKQWHYPQINLPQAWDVTQGSQNVIVAVLDTGIVSSHPDFSGRLVGGFDMISNPVTAGDGDGRDPDPEDVGDFQTPQGSSFHGTHVAGTIGANANNGIGVVGVDWNCRLMTVRVLGQGGGTVDDIANGILYAAGLPNGSGALPPQRADVINMSLGGPGLNAVLEQACNQAAAAGVLLVAAAGNDNSSNPSSPAAFASVLSVGAVDLVKQRAPYSNFSPTVDIWAPGGDMGVDRNGDGFPDGVLSTMADDEGNLFYKFENGTSMASPHVAGVASLIKAADPSLTAAQIRQILISSSEGGLSLPNGGRLVDALAAVQVAAGGQGNTPNAPVLVAGESVVDFGTEELAISVALRNEGTGNLSFVSAVSDPAASWLSGNVVDVDGGDEIVGDRLDLVVDRSGLPNGVQQTTVTLSYVDGANNPFELSVVVRLQVGASIVADDTVFVLLLDPITLESLYQTETRIGENFNFTMSGVADGLYLLVAGTDRDNDDFLGDEGELFGAFPSIDTPLPVEVFDGAGVASLDFALQELVTVQALSENQAPRRTYRRLE